MIELHELKMLDYTVNIVSDKVWESEFTNTIFYHGRAIAISKDAPIEAVNHALNKLKSHA